MVATEGDSEIDPEEEMKPYPDKLKKMLAAVHPFSRAKPVQDSARSYGADTEIVNYECKLYISDFRTDVFEVKGGEFDDRRVFQTRVWTVDARDEFLSGMNDLLAYFEIDAVTEDLFL